MTELPKTWLRTRVEKALVKGFNRAYETVKVDPGHFLLQLRAAYGLPVTTFQGVYSVDIGILDDLGDRVIASGMKVAAVEGAGLGLGGLLTIVPDLSILAGITLRTIQKLSLLYGFQYNTDEETAALWVAAASAAGVDVSRELLEKEVVNRFVPRVIRRIAVQASGEFVEKWSGRLIPVASSFIGAVLNYYFVRAWGKCDIIRYPVDPPHLVDDAVGDAAQELVVERVVVGRHAVGRGDGPEGAGLVVGAAVAHHADGAHRQQHGEGLPDLVVEAGLADLVEID